MRGRRRTPPAALRSASRPLSTYNRRGAGLDRGLLHPAPEQSVSDSQEPSYYEIALSNRQVVFFFVGVLFFVVGAFLCGVWVGRSGQDRLVERARMEAIANNQLLQNVPELSVETGKLQPVAPGATPPDLSVLTRKPATGSTLADDVNARSPEEEPATTPSPTYDEPEPEPAPAPPAAEPEPESAPVPPARAEPTRTEPARAEPAPAGVEPTSGYVVQVFSSKDEGQAKKILGDLKGAGHKAYLSPVKVGAQTMFRVRVGPFAQRGPAEQAAAKVRSKFRLEPWVTAATN
jgi:cell division septation protein DedD